MEISFLSASIGSSLSSAGYFLLIYIKGIYMYHTVFDFWEAHFNNIMYLIREIMRLVQQCVAVCTALYIHIILLPNSLVFIWSIFITASCVNITF